MKSERPAPLPEVTFRKHIRQPTDGFVITEFLPQVPWSGKHNTITVPEPHAALPGGLGMLALLRRRRD